MKSIMGFAFFLLFLAGIMLVTMLEKPREAAETGSDPVLFMGVTWHPVTVGSVAIAEDSGLNVMFTAEGGIKGHAGCNGFRGSIEVSDSGLTVGPLATTRMACPNEIMDREDTFLAVLTKLRQLQGDIQELHLLDEHGNVLMVLAAGTQSEPSN